MSGMDRIIAIHGASPLYMFPVPPIIKRVLPRCRPADNPCFAEEDSDLVCQPGIGWMEINQTLEEKGIRLFFPVRAQELNACLFTRPSPASPSLILVPLRLSVACLAQAAPEVSTVQS